MLSAGVETATVKKVSAFQVAGGQTVGVPGGNEGGAGEPAPNGHVGAGEQQQTGPADKDKAIALQPVVEDVRTILAEPERVPLLWSSSNPLYMTSSAYRADPGIQTASGRTHPQSRGYMTISIPDIRARENIDSDLIQ